MQHSEQCAEIFAAMSKFHGIVNAPTKKGVNAYTKSNYATIEEILAVARAAWAECGLSPHQEPWIDGEYVVIETTIMHASGQWIRNTPLRVKPTRAPKGGTPTTVSADVATTSEKAAVFTYMRRYALQMAFQLQGEKDTDGEPDRVDTGDYDHETGETRQSQQRQYQQREQPRQREELPPTHKGGPEVEEAVKALAVTVTEPGFVVIAESLIKLHGAPSNKTRPWIAFWERASSQRFDPKALVKTAQDNVRQAASPKAEGAVPASAAPSTTSSSTTKTSSTSTTAGGAGTTSGAAATNREAAP